MTTAEILAWCIQGGIALAALSPDAYTYLITTHCQHVERNVFHVSAINDAQIESLFSEIETRFVLFVLG